MTELPTADELAVFQAEVLAHNKRRVHFDAQLTDSGLSNIRCARGANPLCGDRLQVALTLDTRLATITTARFSGDMSAISIAASEILCALLTGASLKAAEALLLDAQALLDGRTEPNTALGAFALFTVVRSYPVRLKTASLPVQTLLAAVRCDPLVVSTDPPI